MHIVTRNVNTAFEELVRGIHTKEIPTVRTDSRNGPVLQIPEPVIVTYEKPRERVLFNQARDCNPFFHVYEALWMLAGRNDLKTLQFYVSTFDQFSDDGRTLNGAYGYRWRNADKYSAREPFDPTSDFFLAIVDQLDILIKHLKEKPESRRAVLQMWNVEDDLLKIDSSRDVCCNTCVYFSIIHKDCQCKNWFLPGEIEHESQKHTLECSKCWGRTYTEHLDMTVCNRSNDLVWGMLGANVVHFSFLQEYMANCLGVEVGMYHQMTNNLHAYESKWEPEKWLSDNQSRWFNHLGFYPGRKELMPLVKDKERFDQEISCFVPTFYSENPNPVSFSEPWLERVAKPMCLAFAAHKRRDYKKAFTYAQQVVSTDWGIAASNWIAKREKSWSKKNAGCAN